MLGIYCYIDLKDGSIVYIGKDSHINRNFRHMQHKSPSKYDVQQINKVIQNNPERYEYKVLDDNVDSLDLLNALEINYIQQLKPKFNYTIGGDGTAGYNHSDETKAKIKKNNARYWLGKKMTKEHILKSVEARKGISHPYNQKINISKSTNTTGFYRVRKEKDKTCKQGYLWTYEYYDENQKHKRIRRTDLFKLKQAVIDRGFVWQILDLDNAINTIKSIAI